DGDRRAGRGAAARADRGHSTGARRYGRGAGSQDERQGPRRAEDAGGEVCSQQAAAPRERGGAGVRGRGVADLAAEQAPQGVEEEKMEAGLVDRSAGPRIVAW